MHSHEALQTKMSRKLVTDNAEMKRLAIGALCSIRKLSGLIRNFFRQPECQYIAR